jgi:hypothetical protein
VKLCYDRPAQISPARDNNVHKLPHDSFLYEELFVRYSGIHGRYWPFGVGLALFGSGVVWLWFYCLGPIILKRLSREE